MREISLWLASHLCEDYSLEVSGSSFCSCWLHYDIFSFHICAKCVSFNSVILVKNYGFLSVVVTHFLVDCTQKCFSLYKCLLVIGTLIKWIWSIVLELNSSQTWQSLEIHWTCFMVSWQGKSTSAVTSQTENGECQAVHQIKTDPAAKCV